MEGKEVIVKKVKKGGHEGHHGGAWKVAYADFVTAMMAFFLLMWLVTAMKQKDLAGIAVYFREYDVTKGEQDIKKKIDAAVQKIELVNQGNAQVSTPQQVQLVDVDSQKGEAIMQALRSDIQIRLAQVADQILIDVYEGAVRIQLVDKDGTPLFPAGSAQLTPVAKQILAVLAEKVIQSGVKIAIEGHTDAHGSSSGGGKTNWELSTERASAARVELERLGVPSLQLLKVSGLADTQPLIGDNPFDPRNRRINLLLYYAK